MTMEEAAREAQKIAKRDRVPMVYGYLPLRELPTAQPIVNNIKELL